MNKRLHKDVYDMIRGGYNIYNDSTIEERNKLYTIILCLQPCISLDIIRTCIIPYTRMPLTLNSHVNSEFAVKIDIEKIPFNIKFFIPNTFPFKPPKFTINNISGCQLKNMNTQTSIFLEDLMKIFYDQWSPVIRLINCLNTIKLAIEIHLNSRFKSGFLIECFK